MYEPDIAKIQSGDERELKELFEKLLPRIRKIIRQAIEPYSDELNADDLEQDAIIRIYSNLHKFRTSANLLTVCSVVARNVAIDAVRRKNAKRRKTTEVDWEDSHLMAEPSNIDSRILLHESIQLLPEIEKKIVEGWIEGKNVRKLAEESGLSPAAVAKRLQRAMKQLESLMLADSK